MSESTLFSLVLEERFLPEVVWHFFFMVPGGVAYVCGHGPVVFYFFGFIIQRLHHISAACS